MSRLNIELVPQSCWYTNVRSNVTRAQWEKCKQYTKAKSGDRCEICGGVGKRYTVETHEVWHYDDERQIQTLVDLIALCPSCHEVKHIGLAERRGKLDRAIRHLQEVNGWSDDHAYEYAVAVFKIWRLRSTVEWTLNINWLATIGLPTTVQVATAGKP